MRFDAETLHQSNGHTDWGAVKATILANLDVAAEFAALGVEFTRSAPNAKGIRECRAVGRRDDVPSAFVNVKTGVYHDSGGDGLTLSLWDFALRFGRHGRWIDVVRHYAARAGVEVGAVRPSRGGRIREAEYLYRDETGAVRYAVHRYRLPNGKKTFSQAPPDGKGGWRFGEGCMDGVEPLPYRLPELLASDRDDPVWVVEGEKDADRLASLGLVATTNHRGADATESTWPRFLGHFYGRDVLVLPDNDARGRAHAHKVAGLLHPIARSVKVVDLPGLAVKGDVSDWLNLGHDLDELGRLAHAAPAWSPDAVPKEPGAAGRTTGASGRVYDYPLVVRGSAVEPKVIDWLWEDRIPYGFLTLFAGRTKVGKSFVTLDLAARLSVGGEVPLAEGARFTPAGTLVISEDPHEYVLAPRLVAAGADMAQIHFMSWEAMAAFTLGDVEMLDDTYGAAGRPRLVVIDPPTNFLGLKDEHKNAEVRGVLMGVSVWAQRHRVAVVLITHCNKGSKKDMAAIDRVIGSVAWASTARVAHIFGPHPEEDGQQVFLPLGSNVGRPSHGFAYRVHDDGERVRVAWLGTVSVEADDVLGGRKVPRGITAVRFLEQMFAEKRQWPSKDLLLAAAARKISQDALLRSPEVKALPIVRRQIVGCDGSRYWEWTAVGDWPPGSAAAENDGSF